MNLWIVGKSLGLLNTWEFQGVFESEALAVAACRDRNYFIAPAVLNRTLPDESIAWDGLRWPVAESE